MARVAAADALLRELQAAYPERGVLLHPCVSLASQEPRGGYASDETYVTDPAACEVVARANAPISEGEILMVVPEEARLTTRCEMARRGMLKILLPQLRQALDDKLGADDADGGLHMLGLPDVLLVQAVVGGGAREAFRARSIISRVASASPRTYLGVTEGVSRRCPALPMARLVMLQ